MRKINYNELKIVELVAILGNLKFAYDKTKESIDVVVDSISRKTLLYELIILNNSYKLPPLTTQYDESAKIISIFDQRM